MIMEERSILRILPREIIFMIISYLDPATLLNLCTVLKRIKYFNIVPTILGVDFIRQSGIKRTPHRPHRMWKSILEWEKTYYLECNGADGIEELGDYELFLDHMRDRLLSWEGLGSQTIEEPSKYLQFKIDKAMTLIQDRSDPAKEQMTKEDQQAVVSLIIKRLLKEFAVEIAWKGDNRYEGVRAPLNSHEGLCKCIMNVSYPKEALWVEYKTTHI